MIPIVAFLALLRDPVATGREGTQIGAAIVVDLIAVIAGFKALGAGLSVQPYDPVTATGNAA